MRGATALLALLASVSVVLQPVIGAAVPADLSHTPIPDDSRLRTAPKKHRAVEEDLAPDNAAAPRVNTARVAKGTAARGYTQRRSTAGAAKATSRRVSRPATSGIAATGGVTAVADTPEADATGVATSSRARRPVVSETAEATGGATALAETPQLDSTGVASSGTTAVVDAPEVATGTTTNGATAVADSPEAAKNTTAPIRGDGIKLPDCKRMSYTGMSAQDIDKLWIESGLEKYTDEWISKQKDHTNWAQNLYMELFDEPDQGDMSCITTGAECRMTTTCNDFNAVGKGGLYYLFQSMQNFHKYMGETRSRFTEETFVSAMGLKDVISKLRINVDRSSKNKINVLGLLSGAMGIAAGFTGPVGGAALGVLGGVMDKMAESAQATNPLELQNASEEQIQTAIEQSTKENLRNIDMLMSAVFGNLISQDNIPNSMKKANVKNAALAVFGGGRWLMNNPTEDLGSHWNQVGRLMKQGMAWQLARAYRFTQIIIRDDMNRDGCKGTNNAWDDQKNWCIDMMQFDGTPKGTLGGINDIDMWKDFGMDKLATMRNTVECWEKNGGKEGSPGLLTDPFKTNSIPPCFFYHHVWKGPRQQKNRGWIKLDQSFAGQSGRSSWPEGRQ